MPSAKTSRNTRILKRILKDTQNVIEGIKNNHVLNDDIKCQVLNLKIIDSFEDYFRDSQSVLIFGKNCNAKAIFVNSLFDQNILPQYGSNWKWIKFKHGLKKSLRLTISEFELLEKYKHIGDHSISANDLERNDAHFECCPTIEIELPNAFLRDHVVIIPPDCQMDLYQDSIFKHFKYKLPILVYVISEDILSDSDIQEIVIIKKMHPDISIMFVSVSDNLELNMESLTESEQHSFEMAEEKHKKLHNVSHQLLRLGYLRQINTQHEDILKQYCLQCNNLIYQSDIASIFIPYVQDTYQSNIFKIATLLSEIHNSCLRAFILSAFDMAREIQITPKRIIYVEEIESKLYNSLIKLASEKQEEICMIIESTLQTMKLNILNLLEGYENKFEGMNQSMKQATMELHQLVLYRLSNSVAIQLMQSVSCLQESFTGTLQRCLESLEKDCELEGNLLASDAVKQILSAAYNIDIKTKTKFKLRNLLETIQLPWNACIQPELDLEWQIQVVDDLIDSLSASKLAKTISTQFQEHIKSSHESFQSAMRSLKNQLDGKLENTEKQRIAIRKKHAPKFAKLALESTSLCDFMRMGMPKLLKEIGRGQFGVVFSCEQWGSLHPCAVKSVVPPDDRHLNDLAMEFYYTRTIPEHPRIVKLCGSVIDYSYGTGNSFAVLLIMERISRDLYSGLRTGLSWPKRIQIAIDVVDAIRYLHSQGLVHRDIKLKNVLLDTDNRAKLTDFGFCKPEAMISGSEVGTPVHMAPELRSRNYDSSVDVYAFGILFWYLCSGKVKLPDQFERCKNKEQLFDSVQKGIRPECLPEFSHACWNLMEQCWAAEPFERPLLGYVQPQLEAIQNNIIL